jgi:hypothetical protein
VIYSDLIQNVIDRAFPEGIAPNLRAIYERRVLDGLIEAQRWVPYLRTRQIRLYPFTSTLYRQGTTVICKPRGKVKRLYTFNSKTLKDIVYYDPCTREDIDRLTAARARDQKYPAEIPFDFGQFNATSTLDKGWRAERGLFCIDKDSVILLPHIDSSERVGIEYEGAKTLYDDDDGIDWGKYQAQVELALENYLRWKSLGKDDRSVGDYAVLQQEWANAIAGLQLDTKDDTEAEIPIEDIGILPRTFMPATTYPWSLGCSYDPTASFFSHLWVMCLDNDKFYNLGALLLDDTVVEMVSGSGEAGGRPEVTYETIRSTNFNLQASDDLFYHLVPHIVDGEPTHGFEGGAVDSTNKTICDGTSCVNVDILCHDDDSYIRLNIRLQDGVPVVTETVAPAESETPVPTPTACTSGNSIILRDVVTQKCMIARLKDGVWSIEEA